MGGVDLADLPLILGTILWLVFLEGLLSADNALVLAMMVRHLPKEGQKRALRYGIWGAFLFRFVAVLLAQYLLDYWIIKVVGGLYLLYLTLAHFARSGSHDADKAKRWGSGFWGTVVSVEIADVVFSIDSILAAVAMADGLPAERIGATERYVIVVSGGLLGILTMRYVAGYFITLLERFRGLEPVAYALVAWIGLKLVSEGLRTAGYLPFELDDRVFWVGMALIVAGGLLYRPKSPPPGQTVPVDTAQNLADATAQVVGGTESIPADVVDHDGDGEPVVADANPPVNPMPA